MTTPRTRPVLLSRLGAAVAILLSIGACSRSTSVLRSFSPAPNSRAVPMSCPHMIPNTPETAIHFEAVSGMCASFRPSRVRFEMTGDLPSPKIDDMGACAASATPSIVFAGGHANVFVHGADTSATETGQPLTFGPLQFVGEQGVVVALDARGNVLEIIWPTLAGVGMGQPIVRVQLTNWNRSLVTSDRTFDVVWDMAAQRDGVTMYIQGRADSLSLSGLPTLQPGASPQPPCLSTLAATSDSVITQFAGIVQFRSNRLRVDLDGDVPAGTLEACGLCAAADLPTVAFTGSADVFRAGSTQSLTVDGQTLAFGPLLPPGILLEPGVVLSTDAAGNALEIIWPKLAGLGSGPPILRLQLAQWAPTLRTGQQIDVALHFDATGADGSTASYLATGRDIDVPVMK